MATTREGKTRFLVCHDYGMGGLWWWIWAGSAEEIVLTLAEAEVRTDPDLLQQAGTWSLEEVDLDHLDGTPALAEMRAQRDAQRDRPGFGALIGRSPIHLSFQEDGSTWLVELGPDGHRLRQVEIGPGGEHERTTPEDWLFDPPMDLYDPQYAEWEIPAAAFEQAWLRAVPPPGPGWTDG